MNKKEQKKTKIYPNLQQTKYPNRPGGITLQEFKNIINKKNKKKPKKVITSPIPTKRMKKPFSMFYR